MYQSRARYIAITLTLFLVELLIATKLSNMPVVRGSLGDFLVVGLIYFFIQAVQPNFFKPVPLAIGVFVFACCIEIAQYFHLANLLGLRKGSVMYILLGNTFSLVDIAMYFLGSIAVCIVDMLCLRK